MSPLWRVLTRLTDVCGGFGGQVALGQGFNLLLTHDGSVFSWGVCNEGQLGQGKAVK